MASTPMDVSMPPVMEAKESGIRNLDLNCRSLLAKRGFGIDSNIGHKEKKMTICVNRSGKIETGALPGKVS